MNYRANQLRMQHRKQVTQLETNWALERYQYQQDILNLQNSTDAKILENLEQDLKKKQTTINNLVNTLGAEEIKSLSDLETLLEGKTLKQLIASYQSETNNLAQKLNQTKERLQFFTENLKTKESIITEYQQEIKQKDQNLAALQKKQEKLAKRKDQLEEDLNHNLSLKEAKITTLETNLLQLAKQKLINQKQAKELVTNLEKEWNQKQTEWQTQAQNQQEYAAQTLAQTKQEHSEEIKQKDQNLAQNQTRIQELQQWNQDQHNRITELENQASVLELKLETSTRELAEKESEWGREKQELVQLHQTLLQEQKEFYLGKVQGLKEQIATEKQTIQQLNQQITAHQTNIATLNQTIQQNNQRATETLQARTNRITQLEEYLSTSQQENQTKQTTIQNLNQDKITLQQQITNLTQTATQSTRTLTENQETINQLNQTLAQQTQTIAELNQAKTALESEKNQAETAQGNLQNKLTRQGEVLIQLLKDKQEEWERIRQQSASTRNSGGRGAIPRSTSIILSAREKFQAEYELIRKVGRSLLSHE